tara:strand:- start:208 stop:444 length:237 start_codon:yes stop_codon:yes gene_type:complete
MGGLFGGGSKPPPGPSQAELEEQDKREERAKRDENEQKRKLASRQISRSKRNRMLMSGDATGVEPPQRTLGPGRNPRA